VEIRLHLWLVLFVVNLYEKPNCTPQHCIMKMLFHHSHSRFVFLYLFGCNFFLCCLSWPISVPIEIVSFYPYSKDRKESSCGCQKRSYDETEDLNNYSSNNYWLLLQERQWLTNRQQSRQSLLWSACATPEPIQLLLSRSWWERYRASTRIVFLSRITTKSSLTSVNSNNPKSSRVTVTVNPQIIFAMDSTATS